MMPLGLVLKMSIGRKINFKNKKDKDFDLNPKKKKNLI